MNKTIVSKLHNSEQDFIKCGITGLCFEIIWTGIINFIHNDKTMKGNSSILMFPIYGMAALFHPIGIKLKGHSFFLRGTIYTFLIFSGEFISGTVLKNHHMCPWDYSKCRCNIKGLIRLDYAPAWFGAGLILERMLLSEKNKKDISQ